MADYYFIIARAVSGLPDKTDEARRVIYERARTALREILRSYDPPLSETDLAVERSTLEVAIERVETESRFSDRRHNAKEEASLSSPGCSVRDKLNDNITVRGDSSKAATAGLAHGSVFVQRPQSVAKNSRRRIYNIFGDGQRITKYPQIRIAVGLIVAALVPVFLYWMMPENNREAKS